MFPDSSTALPAPIAARGAEVRRRLLHHFGPKPVYLASPRPHLTQTDEIEGVLRQVYRVPLDERYAAPVCVLTPAGVANPAVLVVLHGGDGGLDVCCGPGLGREGAGHYHHDMSLELTRAGFVTLTISLRGLGREARDWGFGDCGRDMETRDDIVGYTIFRGSCPMSLWTHDAIAVLDAFSEDERFQTDRLAVAGISTGGELALYLAALDERIRVVCSHGALVSYEDLYTVAHNYAIHAIPGAIGQFDMGDVGIACWPRPLQFQVGEKEPEFWGRRRDSTESEFRRVAEAYRENQAVTELHVSPGGGHAFDTPAAVRFLTRHLLGEGN